MRRVVGGCVALVAALVLAPAAQAGSVPTTGLLSGPVFSGDTAVWSEFDWPEKRGRILAAPPDGPARVLWEGAADGCWRFASVAASETVIAALVNTSWEDGCDPAEQGREILLFGPDGEPLPAPAAPEGAHSWQCAPIDVDVDGDRLAVSVVNCDSHVMIRDLTTGAVQHVRFDAPVPPSLSSPVALAGRYVALHQWDNFDNAGDVVALYDLEQRRQVAQVDMIGWYGGTMSRLSLDVAADGTLLVAGGGGGYFSDILRLRPDAAPASIGHEVFVNGGPPITQAAGEVAVSTKDGAVLIRLSDGRTLPIGGDHGSLVAYNGTRVAWTHERVLHNELLADAIRRPAAAAAPAPAAGAPATAPALQRPAATRCRVPRLKGATLTAARKRLAAGNCRLGEVRRARGARAARRPVVISQAPRAGRTVARGTKVRVRLRSGRVR